MDSKGRNFAAAVTDSLALKSHKEQYVHTCAWNSASQWHCVRLAHTLLVLPENVPLSSMRPRGSARNMVSPKPTSVLWPQRSKPAQEVGDDAAKRERTDPVRGVPAAFACHINDINK